MSSSLGRFALRSGAAAPSSSSSSSSSLLSFLPPSLLRASSSSSPSPSSHRSYSSHFITIPLLSISSSSSSSSPRSFSSTSKRSSSTSSPSFAPKTDSTPPPTAVPSTPAAREEMLIDTANAKRSRDAHQGKFIRDWNALSKSKDGRARQKQFEDPNVVYYNPQSWLNHFRNSWYPKAAFQRIQIAYSHWVMKNQQLQVSLGRTSPAEQKLRLFPWTKEGKLQKRNEEFVASQVQKAFDKFRLVELRCDTQENIDRVTLGLAKKQLTSKLKDPRRNRVFLKATWERTKDYAKPKILSFYKVPILQPLNLYTRHMLVRFDFQERIVLGDQVIDQRTETTVMFEQRSWAEGENEWKVKVRNVQKDPFGLTRLERIAEE